MPRMAGTPAVKNARTRKEGKLIGSMERKNVGKDQIS
jgi:hypothetical protein